jgi:hypothetical protein
MKSVVLAAALAFVSSSAFADTTGPGAKLFKLPGKWVSVLPGTEASANTANTEIPAISAPVVAIPAPAAPAAQIPTAVAPVAASSNIPGYTPDANYSGACHVTVNLADKTYAINNTSSTNMVLSQNKNAVCLPTEKLALDYGFKKAL